MTGYFSRAGDPISFDAWIVLHRQGASRVAEDAVCPGAEVFTIWTGTDWSGHVPPRVFETYVQCSFLAGDGFEHERYSSEVLALAGHQRWVERVHAAVTE